MVSQSWTRLALSVFIKRRWRVHTSVTPLTWEPYPRHPAAERLCRTGAEKPLWWCHPCRLCVQSPQGYYRQRLSELALRGMASEALSCRISSTAVCVEVRPWWGLGGGGQWAGRAGMWGGCWVTLRAVLGAHLRAGMQALSPGLEAQVDVPHALLHSFIPQAHDSGRAPRGKGLRPLSVHRTPSCAL